MPEVRRDTILHRVVWDRDLGEIKEQVKLMSGARMF